MSDKTGIEWTDMTWNPVVGCTIVSPGCTNCYAMGQAARIIRMTPGSHYVGTTKDSKAGPVWTGKLALAPEHILTAPLLKKAPRRIFVNSMGDLFHEDVPDPWIDRVFAMMALTPQHTYQVLTKRAERMRRYISDPAVQGRIARVLLDAVIEGSVRASAMNERTWPVRSIGADIDDPDDIALQSWPLPNVWLGVSAEDQRRADERVPDLLATPAAVRFVSAEPLLGPIDFTSIEVGDGVMNALQPGEWLDEIERWRGTSKDWEDEFLDWFDLDVMPAGGRMHAALDWIIVGGESGQGARPMHPEWVRQIRDACASAGTAFFFKQWGSWLPDDMPSELAEDLDLRGRYAAIGDQQFALQGKKSAGRILDGVEHNAMPARP